MRWLAVGVTAKNLSLHSQAEEGVFNQKSAYSIVPSEPRHPEESISM